MSYFPIQIPYNIQILNAIPLPNFNPIPYCYIPTPYNHYYQSNNMFHSEKQNTNISREYINKKSEK